MQKEAEGLVESLACLGATIERREPSKNFYELSVGGDPILLVDNSGSQLLGFTASRVYPVWRWELNRPASLEASMGPLGIEQRDIEPT